MVEQRTDRAETTRRRTLRAVGGSMAVVAVAGCTDLTASDDEDGGDSTTGGGGTDFASVTSYAFDGEGSIEMGGMSVASTSSGYVADSGDWYVEQTTDMNGTEYRTEWAEIDGRLYSSREDGCRTLSEEELSTVGMGSFSGFYDNTIEIVDGKEAAETTSLDGETARVYEFSTEETRKAWDTDGPVMGEPTQTVYVRDDDGRIVRVEMTPTGVGTGDGEDVMSLHSFDEEFTVERPPDC
ncbi:hypothetical protein [Halopiger djelfimassiliensis]|uniref:hypothetical protein n=1 Tax=Halopiger djelfimassiliensis TaxID=1293047 RepID=UPI00067767B6|nr:hypothetical protein [Halopiger djelfimassiliensis]